MRRCLIAAVVSGLAANAGAISDGAVITNGAATGAMDKPPAEAADSLHAISTRLDRIGRIVVPVMVNLQGPFQFVLDTGANKTVLTPHLAAALGLRVDTDTTFTMNGVTGSAVVPTTVLHRLQAGTAVLEGERVAVADASVVGTDGVLGVDGLKDKLVMVDFKHDRVGIVDAESHRPGLSLARIPADLRFGRLIIIDALAGTHKVKAVIDTGGQRTLGNRALYDALGLRPTMTIRDASAEVVGATDARQQGEREVVRSVTMGDLKIANLIVTFGDFHIFELWDLQRKPAIVIGMDMIGTLDTFAVDYLRDEIQIKVR